VATDFSLRTYGDVSRKEDVVLNAVEILTARETQIMNLLRKTVAIDTVHSFLVDTLRTPSSAAVEQAADYTARDLSTPTRLTNIVEKIVIPFKVAKTQEYVQHYHGENELSRQTRKALMDWANAAEFDLVRSTLVSGASGTTPKMSGLIEATSKSTNHTSHNSGTVWSATILDGLMKGNWDNSNGDVATDLFMGSFLRSQTDLFAQKTNVVVNTPNGMASIVRTVSSFQTSFGTVMIHTHRYIQQSGDATGRVLALRPEKLAIAYLNRPFIDTGLARSGAYDFRAVDAELTLEVNNQDSNWYADGFDID